MAPLNDDDAVEKHAVMEEIAKRRNSWFSYFFNFESDNLHHRKIVTVQKENVQTNSMEVDSPDEKSAFSDKIVDNSNDKFSLFRKTEETKKSELNSTCKNCKLEQRKDSRQFIYKKRDPDNITKQGSITAVLMDFSPQWFKSLMRDPEFVMTGGKKAEYNE